MKNILRSMFRILGLRYLPIIASPTAQPVANSKNQQESFKCYRTMGNMLQERILGTTGKHIPPPVLSYTTNLFLSLSLASLQTCFKILPEACLWNPTGIPIFGISCLRKAVTGLATFSARIVIYLMLIRHAGT